MALSRNAADLIAIRFLLGLFEAGLFVRPLFGPQRSG